MISSTSRLCQPQARERTSSTHKKMGQRTKSLAPGPPFSIARQLRAEVHQSSGSAPCRVSKLLQSLLLRKQLIVAILI